MMTRLTIVYFIVRLRGAITSLHSKALAEAILRALQQQLGAVIIGYILSPGTVPCAGFSGYLRPRPRASARGHRLPLFDQIWFS